MFSCDVRKAIHTIYKSKELNEFDTMKYLKQPDGISYDVYDIEIVIVVAFRICSKESVLFRRFIINEISTIKKATPITLFVASVRGNTDGIVEAYSISHSFPIHGCKGSVWLDGSSKVRRRAVSAESSSNEFERIQSENLATACHTLEEHPATETSD